MKKKESLSSPKKIVITAGATREPIDAVRHISNFATGNLGVVLAQEARKRGYAVTLLFGYGETMIPEDIETIRFTTTDDLLEKALSEIEDADIYISTAAVSDFAPVYTDEKISSDQEELVIRLKPTPKVLREVKKKACKTTRFVAFKLTYKEEENRLVQKAVKSYGDIADIIVANDLTWVDAKEHKALLLYRGNIIRQMSSKHEIACAIFDCLEKEDPKEKGL